MEKEASMSAPNKMHEGNKAAAAAPAITTAEDVELANVHQPEAKAPLHEDIMQLSRLGEIVPIQKLIESGGASATYQDEEGITPLHWAAINNHYALCKYLIDAGADVNAKGGEAVATPAMWAAQRCNYYIVQLLLQSGANPLLTDIQGYNLLHLATFDGNVFLLVLLLHQDIPVDGPDPQGHTCLMWAAYKGYAACVDLFLRWGASVSATDETGFTALHWAVVKGSQPCIQQLVEYGSDRFAETSDHKTPASIAVEMRSLRMWEQALENCGYDSDGNARTLPIPYAVLLRQRFHLKRLLFLWPFFTIFAAIYILSGMVVYAAVPLTVICVYTFQWVAQQFLTLAPPDMKHLHQTPYLAGVFAASCFWIGIRWITRILPNTYSTNPLLNFIFGLSYSCCAYFYILSMIEDPGYVPKTNSRTQQKAIIDELLSLWKFDEENFCVQCMIRTPLRSNHCRRCKKCVAKHDHHCPWIDNCVGVNNLRHFFLYITALEIGILLFVRLVIAHLENLPAPDVVHCNIFADEICSIILRDTFTVVLTGWSCLQLSWVTMLLTVQLLQISRAKTTFEIVRGHTPHISRASEAVTTALTSGSTSMAGGQLGPSASQPHGHGHGHQHGKGCFAQWKKLLGLDTFIATAQDGLEQRNRNRRRENPFSRGIVTNCRDFWYDPAPYFGKREVGAAMLDGAVVNYARMYELPPRMKAPRSRSGGGDTSIVYTSIGSDNVV